jgi:hypothetical protein
VRFVAGGAALILVTLSLLHVYWAGYGVQSSALIPEVDGSPVFRPGRLGTLAVAIALAGAGFLIVERAGLGPAIIPSSIAHWGSWFVAAAFLGRAIGDFRLVGFFKRVRGSRFAELDTRVFSPLCAVVGLASAAVAAAGG